MTAMFEIDKTAIVSCYADAAAFLVMLLLMLLSERSHRRVSPPLRVIRWFYAFLTVTCVISFIVHAMIRQEAPWCHSVAIAGESLKEWFIFVTIYLWNAYVEKKLSTAGRSRPVLKALFRLPLSVFTVLLIVNLFTGVIFTCTEDNRYEYTWLYYAFVAVEGVYFAIPVIRIWIHNRKATKVCFVRIIPMLVPIIFGMTTKYLIPCEADVLGFAIGIMLLYSTIMDEIRCLDEESGLYNKNFLAYLIDLSLSGKYDARSALILETTGSLPAGFEILRDTLHRNGDVIRMEEKKFLMFSGTDSRSEQQLLSTRVEESVVKHNTDHPEDNVRIAVRCRMRTGDENFFEFLRSMIEEKDAGDPVRGVVSMISELDRLDKELELAADIQANTLPTNFPPFPERTEFDLYASMMPAKEVGGDFYDFFMIDRDHLALVIADVSGKGVPAALFMMVSKSLIKNQLMSGCDPAAALESVNQQLCERNSSMMFVTVWTAVLEISTGRGTACNAGHENPEIRRGGGGFELLRYKHGMSLGVSKKAKYENREFEMRPGDCVFVYTDGVPEATRADNEMFGSERLADTLNRNADAAPEELIRRMSGEVSLFADGAPQFDDITMLCLKYYGTRKSGSEAE